MAEINITVGSEADKEKILAFSEAIKYSWHPACYREGKCCGCSVGAECPFNEPCDERCESFGNCTYKITK